jgi:protease PrsW
MGIALLERKGRSAAVAFAPGFVLAVVLHSAFNHLTATPRLASLATLVTLPPLMFFVFQRSEKAVADWLGSGFDADARMLETINSGTFPESPAGQYLSSLKERFHGPIVADLLCYLRLYTELALRAKGILMMRENGFAPKIDDETRARFVEMRYLEKSIGRTGLMAIHPMLHMSRQDLWQLYMLESP